MTIVNTVDYITISSTGNATDFGDLSAAKTGTATCASSTRSLVSGGYTGSSKTRALFQRNAVLNYVTIASLGNGADFGDCEDGTKSAGTSNGHGGLS